MRVHNPGVVERPDGTKTNTLPRLGTSPLPPSLPRNENERHDCGGTTYPPLFYPNVPKHLHPPVGIQLLTSLTAVVLFPVSPFRVFCLLCRTTHSLISPSFL